MWIGCPTRRGAATSRGLRSQPRPIAKGWEPLAFARRDTSAVAPGVLEITDRSKLRKAPANTRLDADVRSCDAASATGNVHPRRSGGCPTQVPTRDRTEARHAPFAPQSPTRSGPDVALGQPHTQLEILMSNKTSRRHSASSLSSRLSIVLGLSLALAATSASAAFEGPAVARTWAGDTMLYRAIPIERE